MSTADYSARITGVETETRELRKAVDIVFGKLDTQGAKLDAITSALHELRANRGPSMRDMMTMAAAGIVIIGAYTASVVFLARSGISEDMQQMRDRLTRIETVLSMATGRRPVTPGVWVPEIAGR